MLKILAMAGLAALVTACAAPTASDTMQAPSGSTASGESTAAGLGFHGPVYRSNKADGPN